MPNDDLGSIVPASLLNLGVGGGGAAWMLRGPGVFPRGTPLGRPSGRRSGKAQKPRRSPSDDDDRRGSRLRDKLPDLKDLICEAAKKWGDDREEPEPKPVPQPGPLPDPSVPGDFGGALDIHGTVSRMLPEEAAEYLGSLSPEQRQAYATFKTFIALPKPAPGRETSPRAKPQTITAGLLRAADGPERHPSRALRHLRASPDWDRVSPLDRVRLASGLQLLDQAGDADWLSRMTAGDVTRLLTEREGQRTLARLATGSPDQRARDYLAEFG